VGYTPFGKTKFPRPDSQGGRVLESISKRRGRTVRQVILNFLTRLDGVFTIPKAGNIEHTQENAGGAGWTLSHEDVAAIDHAFPAPAKDVPLAML
jgi:diketogulonate reductase-like aldo/keto reductase